MFPPDNVNKLLAWVAVKSPPSQFNTAPSAKNISLHCNTAEPNAPPSDVTGIIAPLADMSFSSAVLPDTTTFLH